MKTGSVHATKHDEDHIPSTISTEVPATTTIHPTVTCPEIPSIPSNTNIFEAQDISIELTEPELTTQIAQHKAEKWRLLLGVRSACDRQSLTS